MANLLLEVLLAAESTYLQRTGWIAADIKDNNIKWTSSDGNYVNVVQDVAVQTQKERDRRRT